MIIPILGTPKFDDLGLLPVADIKQMRQGMKDLIDQGHPVDMPIGIPIQDLARMTLTAIAYITLAEKLATSEDPLAIEAQALLSTKPPPPIPSRVLNPLG